jgi:soluble lytic murein transglycosylase-like protein
MLIRECPASPGHLPRPSVPARPEARIKLAAFARQVVVAFVAAGTVIFTANQVRPVFLGQAPVAGRMLAGAYLDSATLRAPWLSLPEAMAMRHPQFQRDVEAFASDLRNTGNLTIERADSIARVAVREAYHRRVPPALVLGVMLTENDAFKRSARSKVGALGLMQIMPRLWTPNLGPILGHNLRDDETNLRYGVYILKHFAARTADTLDAGEVIRTALLSYNGCVQGKNTPDCRAYPEKVRRHVIEDARAICAGQTFQDCVALPLWAAVRDTTTPQPNAAAAGMPLMVSDRVRDKPRIALRTVNRNDRMSSFLLGLVSPRGD